MKAVKEVGVSRKRWETAGALKLTKAILQLWEGTRQVALLTRSNCLLNSGGFLQLRARRRRAVCLGNDQRSGRLCPCARSPPAPLCVNGPGALAPGVSLVALGREA